MDFAYLVACRPSVLIYKSEHHTYAEVYRLLAFADSWGTINSLWDSRPVAFG